MEKKCKKCGIVKNVLCFYKIKHGKYGVVAICRKCMSIKRKEKYSPEKSRLRDINYNKKANNKCVGCGRDIWRDSIRCNKCSHLYRRSSQLGVLHSEEHKHKISIGCLKRKERDGYINSPETRKKMKGRHHSIESRNKMSRIKIEYYSSSRCRGKGKTFDTKIELAVQSELDNRGITYEHPYNAGGIACVDFYLPKYRIVIQADGDFWHSPKINKGRDIAQDAALGFLGYKVYRFWEHEINKSAKECIDSIKEIKES